MAARRPAFRRTISWRTMVIATDRSSTDDGYEYEFSGGRRFRSRKSSVGGCGYVVDGEGQYVLDGLGNKIPIPCSDSPVTGQYVLDGTGDQVLDGLNEPVLSPA